MAEEDVEPIANGSVAVSIRKIDDGDANRRFVWGLASLLAKNTEFYLDRDDAMDGPRGLKFLIHHCKYVTDPVTGEVTIRTASLRKLSKEEFDRIKARMIYVTVNDLLKGVSEKELRQEILDYIDGKKGGANGR